MAWGAAHALFQKLLLFLQETHSVCPKIYCTRDHYMFAHRFAKPFSERGLNLIYLIVRCGLRCGRSLWTERKCSVRKNVAIIYWSLWHTPRKFGSNNSTYARHVQEKMNKMPSNKLMQPCVMLVLHRQLAHLFVTQPVKLSGTVCFSLAFLSTEVTKFHKKHNHTDTKEFSRI